MSNEKNVTKRILEAKTRQPEYLRLDVEPKVGGQSLLHDEFGMPKTGGGQRRNIPPIKEISNEPVVVKASKPTKIKNRNYFPVSRKEGGNYIKVPDFTGSNIEEDDKFIPPKSNFVSVGNMEHAWYDEKVTGPSMVDNNDDVDVDNLQGINPLAEDDKENSKIGEAVEFFTKRLQYVKTLVITELSEITDVEEIKNLRQNTFGENGIFTEVVKKIMSLNINKHSLTTLVDDMYSEIDLEIQGKEFELQSEAEDDGIAEEWPEDIAQIPLADEPIADNEDKAAIQEGEFAIIVHNDIVDIVKDIESARDLISKIVLNDNVDLGEIQLVKRIKIDFGIILGD